MSSVGLWQARSFFAHTAVKPEKSTISPVPTTTPPSSTFIDFYGHSLTFVCFPLSLSLHLASFLTSENISHGINLRKAPVLQYLYVHGLVFD